MSQSSEHILLTYVCQALLTMKMNDDFTYQIPTQIIHVAIATGHWLLQLIKYMEQHHNWQTAQQHVIVDARATG